MRDTIEKAGSVCGGMAKLAGLIGVSVQVVSNWRTRGVPLEHCVGIEQATEGAVRRWDLRPEDWHRIWPELIDIDGAPAVPEPTTTPGTLTQD